MYLDYFGLKQKPFLITPDPVFLYPSPVHQQALAHLRYGLQREGGFLLLTGEVGTGKTTLCRLFMDNLPDNFRLAYLLNTKLESSGLLSGICREFGIALDSALGVNELVEKIYDNLLEVHAAGMHTLLVIEEAQNLTPDVLETLRLLTNLETSSTKLLHILLIGQPELLATLRQPGLRQLNQRVVSRSHLGPLGKQELPPYFKHRLKMAGTDRPLFTDSALTQIYRRTGGIPRLVNLLAEHCLMGAYAVGTPQVTAAIVRKAAAEIFATLQQPHQKSHWPLIASVAMALIVGAGILLLTPIASWTNNQLQAFRGSEAHTTVEAADITAGSPANGKQQAKIESPVSALVPDTAPDIAPAVVSTVDAGDEQADGRNDLLSESPTSVATDNYPSAYQRLLSHWKVFEEVVSEEQLCALALAHDLLCVRQAAASANDLRRVHSPMIVKLFDRSDGLDIYYLEPVKDNTLMLANSRGERPFDADSEMSQLHPEIVFLWRPPEGYTGPLLPGETNLPLVSSVQQWLTDSGYLAAGLVTGGVYSEYLTEKVEAFQADNGLDVDGILGQQTLLELSRRGEAAAQLTETQN